MTSLPVMTLSIGLRDSQEYARAEGLPLRSMRRRYWYSAGGGISMTIVLFTLREWMNDDFLCLTIKTAGHSLVYDWDKKIIQKECWGMESVLDCSKFTRRLFYFCSCYPVFCHWYDLSIDEWWLHAWIVIHSIIQLSKQQHMGSLVLLWYHLHDKRIMDNLGCVVSYANTIT